MYNVFDNMGWEHASLIGMSACGVALLIGGQMVDSTYYAVAVATFGVALLAYHLVLGGGPSLSK